MKFHSDLRTESFFKKTKSTEQLDSLCTENPFGMKKDGKYGRRSGRG